MIRLEILVKISPYKRHEFLQVIKNICNSHSQNKSVSPITVFQDVKVENTFKCQGEWDSHPLMEKYLNSSTWEILVGAIQVLGEIEYARVYEIDKTENITDLKL